MKLLYSLGIFPKISETFILNEILEVQRQGVDVIIFSQKMNNEKIEHESIKDIKNIYYSRKDSCTRIILNHIIMFFTYPKRYLKTLISVFSPSIGIRKMFIFNLGDIIRVNDISPDIIHAHFGKSGADFAMLCKMLLDIDYTFTTHGTDIFLRPPKNYPQKTNLSKKHVTISNYNKKYLIDFFGLHDKDIDIIHCGIDFERPELKMHKKIDDKKITILNVGRLNKLKDQETLLKICSYLKERKVNFICKIIGEGEERKNLEQIIMKKNLQKNVILMGAKPHSIVFEELNQSNVFVLTSISEGIPVCLMEAMAMNVPVVSSNINGIPELIDDGVNGVLCDIKDVTCFVSGIYKVINNELNETGYTKVYNSFNLKKEVSKLIEIWQ